MPTLISPIIIPATDDATPYQTPVANTEINEWITATLGKNPTHHTTSADITILTPTPRPTTHINFLAYDLITSLGTPLDHLPQGTALILSEEQNTWTTPPPLAHTMLSTLQLNPPHHNN